MIDSCCWFGDDTDNCYVIKFSDISELFSGNDIILAQYVLGFDGF